MEKPAPTQFPIHELLSRRYSPLAFSPRPVEHWKLQCIFEAARGAPSSYNQQPWRFIVAQKEDSASFDKVLQCLVPANQEWAGLCPVLALGVTQLIFDRNGHPNRHAFHDLGQAMGNLATQATALGVYVHQMAGMNPDKARELWAIPAEFEAVTGIALGYLGSADRLSAALQARESAPRSRKPQQEFVFGESWGQAARWISDVS